MLDVTREARTPGQWIKGMMQAASTITIGRVIKRLLKRNGLRRDDTLLYSIWFLNSADAAARLALTGGWTAATRGHTSDIYDNPWHFRSDAVRDRLLHGLKRVISISDYGRDYLKSKFPGRTTPANVCRSSSKCSRPWRDADPTDASDGH